MTFNRNGSSDIYGYDLSTQLELIICTDSAWQGYPDINNNFIVWQDNRNGDFDIFAFDLLTQTEFPIATGAGDQIRPSVSGNTVVWEMNGDIYGAIINITGITREMIVDINPDTLNTKSQGRYVTAYITLPEGFNVSDIDTASIQIIDINGDSIEQFYIDPTFTPVVGDHDEDEIPDLTVKFDRQELISLPILLGDDTITIELYLLTGEHFKGSDMIRVISRCK